MLCMSEPTEKREGLSFVYKLPSRSIPSIYEQYQDALTRIRRIRHLRFRGGRVSGESIVNILMMNFLELTPEQQEELLARCLPVLEARVLPRKDRSAKPQDLGPKELDPIPKTAIQGELVEEPKKSRSRRKA